MVAGKVRHWKHGWVPLDDYARAIVAGKKLKSNTGGKVIEPDFDEYDRLLRKKYGIDPVQQEREQRQAKRAEWLKNHPEEAWMAPGPGEVRTRRNGPSNVTVVGGYPEVIFSEPLEVDRRPDDQYREVAEDVSFALRDFPRAAKNPLIIGFTDSLKPSVMADTNNLGPHKIRVNADMWDRPGITFAAVQTMREDKFGVTAVSIDPTESEEDQLAEFRRNVITHEVGHVLHMRDLDELINVPVTQVGDPRWGAIEAFVQEPVTPRQMRYTDIDPPRNGPYTLDSSIARWEVDSLNKKSAYATSNPFEFFAEAFADGMINGNQASESGKRAVQIAEQQFGKGSPSVRDRMYGKDPHIMDRAALDAVFGRKV